MATAMPELVFAVITALYIYVHINVVYVYIT